MFGKLDQPENMKLKDLDWRERWTLIPIIAFCIWIGVYPAPFLKRLEVPVRAIVEKIEASPIQAAEAPAFRTVKAVEPSGPDQ